jgi:hypothetical protein
MVFLVSISWIFSLYVNALYAMPYTNATAQPLTKDNSTTSSAPSVLRLSPVPVNNGTTTSQSSTNNKVNTNADTHGSHDSHSIDTSTSSTSSTSNHNKDNMNSHDLAHKIINKIKQKFKVGDIPFP